MKERVRRLGLHTVCGEARCPNLAECWGEGTATLMLLGEICTRGCRFCAVKTARRGEPPDPDEPRKVAQAVAEMGLDHVVLTSVDRDDLADGGAAHFAATVAEVRRLCPGVGVELLTPDFRGSESALGSVLDAAPEVLAHNIEVVRRLTPAIRDQRCDYDLSLELLRRARALAPRIETKSSIMLGLGESDAEVREALSDLRAAGVGTVTLGQYLRPTPKHAPVVEYCPPERFRTLAKWARELGFRRVASDPLVRSSYRAGALFEGAGTDR